MKKLYNFLTTKAVSEIQLKASAYKINHQNREDNSVAVEEIKFKGIESNFYPDYKEVLDTAKLCGNLIKKALKKNKLEQKGNTESIEPTILKEQIPEKHSINIETSKEVPNFKISPQFLVDNQAELDAIKKAGEKFCVKISEDTISNFYRYHTKRLETAKLYENARNKILEKEKLEQEINSEYLDQTIRIGEQISEDSSINIETSRKVPNFKIKPQFLEDNQAELDAIKKVDEKFCIRISEETISNFYHYYNKRLETAKLYDGYLKKTLQQEELAQEVNSEFIDQTILIGEQISEGCSM